ncbi:hypothetical protein K2173_013769 [Erythroxylum novogranatense]|uniref:ZF-HD dimerization-type domain-containing protein n=1 Tax=Erythroxylum novogranatense TaxID=1862640 RepID=A0AAV8SCT4_9ROSI|nr:hypothetical protein K2173_013769 [Erythroxylum novogranatense]
MDLTPAATTTTTTTTTTPPRKSPEPDTETPTRIQPAKPLSFTNGVLKRHHPHHHHHHIAQPIVISYKECLKNHAASLGGHALDGCGEFMPSPTATHTDPTSLTCAACGCHRNFHRREPEDSPPPANTTTTLEYQPHHRHHPPPPPAPLSHRSPNSASPPPISSSYYPSAPHMLLALSGGLNDNATLSVPPGSSSARKRFRTKFTQSQKEKMFEFAQRVGWKMQKRDEDLVMEFCNEIGVDKGVLKVWMHNNKNTFGKRDGNNNNNGNGIATADLETTHSDINHNMNNNSTENMNHHHHSLQLDNDSLAHVGTNGSSSSS